MELCEKVVTWSERTCNQGGSLPVGRVKVPEEVSQCLAVGYDMARLRSGGSWNHSQD
jgi:hypothetical protein